MDLIQLNIKGISYSQTQSGAYALVLNEVGGSRNLPIIIGAFEAQSIAVALEKGLKTPRPLTHDLFKSFAKTFNVKLKQVIIHKLVDGIFYSSLVCVKNNIEEIIDSRTSDAIALAVRFGAPIYTYENILDEAGVILKIKDTLIAEGEKIIKNKLVEDTTKAKQPFSNISLKELNEKLKIAVASEDYELAAQIRDEINKRS